MPYVIERWRMLTNFPTIRSKAVKKMATIDKLTNDEKKLKLVKKRSSADFTSDVLNWKH